MCRDINIQIINIQPINVDGSLSTNVYLHNLIISLLVLSSIKLNICICLKSLGTCFSNNLYISYMFNIVYVVIYNLHLQRQHV